MSYDSLGTWSTLNGTDNGTGLPNSQHGSGDTFSSKFLTEIIIIVFVSLISIFGIIGNGTVIWFLGFCMKRNPFTTFILHLAVADLGALICLFTFPIIYLLESFLCLVPYMHLIILLGSILFLFMCNTGQYLLTAISMDRCVSVVFPLWHRCHRPPYFSTLVCATIWIIDFLITVIFIIHFNFEVTMIPLFYLLLMNAILCLPLMTVSTLVLFIKVYFRSQQRKKGKALTAILLALLFFLFLAFPSTCILLYTLCNGGNNTETFIGLLCSCLNSSVNPLIYFLIGRKKHSPSRESLKVVFQRVFKEEEDCRKKRDIQVQTQIE